MDRRSICGVGADHSRMPEALLVLLSVANGWQKPRQRKFQSVIDEIVALRRLGFRFVALADDNFYPVTLTDLRPGARAGQHGEGG